MSLFFQKLDPDTNLRLTMIFTNFTLVFLQLTASDMSVFLAAVGFLMKVLFNSWQDLNLFLFIYSHPSL